MTNLLFLVAFEIRKISAVTAASSRNRITLLVKLHTEVETHAVQDLFDLIQRLLAEVLGGKHLALGALDQVANRPDVGILETVVRTNAQLQLINRAIELIVARQRRTLHLRVSKIVRVLFEVDEDRHVILDQLCRESD